MISSLFGRRFAARRVSGGRGRDATRTAFFHPLGEILESRNLLAFDLTISPAATANVSTDDATLPGTRIFTATNNGARLSLADMDSAFNAGLNVKVSSGSGIVILPPFEPGSISTSGFTTHVFNNGVDKSLTIENGTGTNSNQADIAVTGLQMSSKGALILDANQNVTLSGEIIAGAITITAETGSITMPSGGELSAGSLNLTAGGDIGTEAVRVLTSTNQLTTDTSANNGDQFFIEASGLAALNLNAGTGVIRLTLNAGGIADLDSSTDVVSAFVSLILLDSNSQNVGSASNPIATSVDTLAVRNDAGDGDQFLVESNGVTSLSLNAGTGNVSLNLSHGGVADTDTIFDLIASPATISLNDPVAKTFGTADDPVNAAVGSLSVDTSTAGGDQHIEANGLSALNLNAGGGDITLTLPVGAVGDGDPDVDISADVATVVLNDPVPHGFGSGSGFIITAVNHLLVSTAAGGGSQFMRESSGLTGLNLDAGAGATTLILTAGAVADTDSSDDIRAIVATVTLSDPAPKDFGSSLNPIATNVNVISANTSAGGGNQFISELNALFGLTLNAGIGDVTLTVGGSVSDGVAADIDIAADVASIIAAAATPPNFGSIGARIQTSVNELSISTATGGGNQFVTEVDGLSALNLNAGAGNVTLTLTAGSVSDSDSSTDITAGTATVTLLDPVTRNFGAGDKPIGANTNTLSVDTAAGGGNQFISEANDTIFTANAGMGSITLAGGTFNLAAGNAIQDTSTLVVNIPANLNLASNSETIGGLAGSGTVAFQSDQITESLIVGGNNQDTNFTGNLTGNGINGANPQDSFRKQGSGTLTFSGNHGFTGEYSVEGGTLLVKGMLASSSIPVYASAGAVLGGTGTLNRPAQINVGGHLAPGTSPGTLSTGDLDFQSGSVFGVEIDGGTVGDFDQVQVTGDLAIATSGDGVALNFTKVGSLNLGSGQVLVLIENDGTDDIQGEFKNLPHNAILGSNFLGSGLTAKITYSGPLASDNDVVITLSSGSLFPWHNPNNALDAVGSGAQPPADDIVAPGDAAAIINYINGFGAGPIPENAVIGEPFGFLDTAGGPNDTGDNNVAPNDALAVINAINGGQGGEGERISALPASHSALRNPNSALQNDQALLAITSEFTNLFSTTKKRR